MKLLRFTTSENYEMSVNPRYITYIYKKSDNLTRIVVDQHGFTVGIPIDEVENQINEALKGEITNEE